MPELPLRNADVLLTPIVNILRQATFLLGGDGPGLRRGGSLEIFLQIVEGQTCHVLFATGGGSPFY